VELTNSNARLQFDFKKYVENALKNITATVGGISAAEVDGCLSNLKKAGRYQKDVY
jgi:sulfite reductase alpha subunit-like flavoprotein